jgi:TRAP-type C4-dicarboxylate transport system substrate-binding protein
MNARILAVITLIALLLVAGTASAVDLKIATIAPEGSTWMKDMRAASAEIAERTDGRVNIKLYGGGVMGDDKKVLRKIRIGQLHGGVFTANSMEQYYPDLNIYGLPLLFENDAEVQYVRERVDPKLEAGLEEAGFVSFGFAGGGFARFLSNTPVRSVDDLKGKKVWVPEGDQISYRAMEALDLSPVTLPVTDVLTGLQTGLIDIVASPPVAVLVLQWHTKVDYLTELPLLYTLGYLAIDKRAFSRLSEADQAVVDEVMNRVYENFDRINQADNEQALSALANTGVDFVEPVDGAIDRWREPVMAANESLAEEGYLSPELLDEVQALLAEYRTRAAATAQADGDSP